jgi:hypothetical protein
VKPWKRDFSFGGCEHHRTCYKGKKLRERVLNQFIKLNLLLKSNILSWDDLMKRFLLVKQIPIRKLFLWRVQTGWMVGESGRCRSYLWSILMQKCWAVCLKFEGMKWTRFCGDWNWKGGWFEYEGWWLNLRKKCNWVSMWRFEFQVPVDDCGISIRFTGICDGY